MKNRLTKYPKSNWQTFIKHYSGRHNQQDHGNRYRMDSSTGERVIKPKVSSSPQKVIGKVMTIDGLLHSSIVDHLMAARYTTYDSGKENIQYYLNKIQGYDKKPHVVSEGQLQDYIKQGEKELFRGIASNGKNAEQFAEAFRSGDFFLGKGIYGNGTNTAYGSKGSMVAENYKEGNDGALLHMSLRSDARIITHEDLEKVWLNANKRLKERMDIVSQDTGLSSKEKNEQLNRLDEMHSLITDSGRLATVLGFDAINVEERSYIVVLNRTAVRVAKKEK